MGAPRANAKPWRFDGEIFGFGTQSGHRIVVGRWWSTPFGAFSDVMLEDPEGLRRLIAPTADVATFIADTYFFDEVVTTAVEVRAEGHQRVVCAGGLDVNVGIGARDSIGVLLRLVPRRLRLSRLWATMIDPVARRALAGVRVHGSARGGRREWYGAHDVHRLAWVTATWNGAGLGGMSDVVPPVRFGFGSVPRRPSLVQVTTTVDVGRQSSENVPT